MNVIIFIMLIFAGIGLLDKILGGKTGLSKDFDQGLTFMGSIALCMVGISCLGIVFVQSNADKIGSLASVLPFDPSLFIGLILSPDMGGLAISLEMAETNPIGVFSGALLSACIGTLVCFQLPIFLSALSKNEVLEMMEGILLGIIVIPLGLFIGAFMLGLSLSEILAHMIPIFIFCMILALSFKISKIATAKCLLRIGQGVQILTYILFALVMIGLFIPKYQIADYSLVSDTFVSLGKMIIVICGSMVMSHTAMIVFPNQLHWISKKLKTNEASIIGIILSMTTSMAMVPLFSQMDRRGKLMNAAFSVSGAYILGGQMAYVAGLTTSLQLTAFIVTKGICGLSAILLALLVFKDDVDKEEFIKGAPEKTENAQNVEEEA